MHYESPHGKIGQAFRPPLMGSKGAVVANHPLAAQAGLRLLHQGGNAVDAAIAVAFALGVAEPAGSSIGGDGFVMTHIAADAALQVANGTGAAPAMASPDRYRDGIPIYGARGISVPGILDALLATHERYGTVPLARCLEPAIELCLDGVPVTHGQAASARAHAMLRDAPTSGAVFAPGGTWLEPGDLRRNPDLARTYQTIADQGRDAFYRGDIAREIALACEDAGGMLRYEDLARHQMQWQAPIGVEYRGRWVYEAPPNSSGHVLLQELNMLEQFDAAAMGYLSPETVHVMTECKKLAFADREAYMADPDYVDVPVEGLLSKAYAAERAAMIDLDRALPDAFCDEGDPWAHMDRQPDAGRKYRRDGVLHHPDGTRHRMAAAQMAGAAGSDTTHYCVVDRWGNAVGALQSVQTGYGSCLIAGNTGVLMNNRMTYWHLDPGHIDYLQPGQRVRHTMNPVMVFSGPLDGDVAGGNGRAGSLNGANGSGDGLAAGAAAPALELVCGTPGADTQVQTNFQIVAGIFDHGLNVAEAIEGPRWTHYQAATSSTYPHEDASRLDIEARVGDELLDGIRQRGHSVRAIAPFDGAGSAGAIQLHRAAGTMSAASDPRRDGDATVW